MALNDLMVRQAKPQEKKYTLSDGRGLILEVRPNGRKYWVVRVWKDGKERRRHIGQYPEMSLKDARMQAASVREQPLGLTADAMGSITFGEIVEEWLEKRMSGKAASYMRSLKLRVNNYILPEFKDVELKSITSGAILRLCRNIEALGNIDTAVRVKMLIGQVFRYAIATDR
ncbi:MAG: integrase arm-type DNA-binding domain-containing protein, partial [Synergistaceae bacterium]|nr:integrase arm-type DNA-binding domain-containing protein [Synergistaceae bacterium]